MATLNQLRDMGFTESEHIPFTKSFRVRCPCCQALVINGFPTHETGCPNARAECAGCGTTITAGQKYCRDCM